MTELHEKLRGYKEEIESAMESAREEFERMYMEKRQKAEQVAAENVDVPTVLTS